MTNDEKVLRYLQDAHVLLEAADDLVDHETGSTYDVPEWHVCQLSEMLVDAVEIWEAKILAT